MPPTSKVENPVREEPTTRLGLDSCATTSNNGIETDSCVTTPNTRIGTDSCDTATSTARSGSPGPTGKEIEKLERAFAKDKNIQRREAFIKMGIAAIAGSIFGLSAPGFDQTYLAWFGLAPLFALIFSASSIKSAFARSFVFGACYNLVYLHWFLSLDPAWAWFSPKFTMVTAVFWWMFASLHQGTIFGVFAILARKIPLTANSIRREALPAILVLPLLWVILFNKVGNSPMFVGIPWSMVEYSQYKNLVILQIAKYIGGIGIGTIIVMANTALYLLLVTLIKRSKGSQPTDHHAARFKPSMRECILSVSLTVVLIAGILAYGNNAIANPAKVDRSPIAISLVQGNLAGSIHGAESPEVVTRYVTMSQQAPLGVCLWTEWVLPISLNKNKPILDALSALAASQGKDWLVGALEKSGNDTYNAIYGVTSAGTVDSAPYRKRYLVPFGEFLPEWMTEMGVRGLIATCSPHRCSLQKGTSANVIKLKSTSAGALICLEVVSPELAADSVRNGAEILTDLSNTTWFTSPDVGKQLIAFSVMRAAETCRSVSFCTTTGPSAIVHTDGRILGTTKPHQAELLSRSTYRRTDITPFVRWFH